jgi:glucose-6-phosphate 1-dehydrogenase
LGARAKRAGADMVGRELELIVDNSGEDEMSAYERLIGDALRGDPTLFTREDAVLESWRIIDPVLTMTTPLETYEPGTWGPPKADHLGRRLATAMAAPRETT